MLEFKKNILRTSFDDEDVPGCTLIFFSVEIENQIYDYAESTLISNGSATLVYTGAVGNLSYSVDGGAFTDSGSNTTITLTDLTEGAYDVDVRDENMCLVSRRVIVSSSYKYLLSTGVGSCPTGTDYHIVVYGTSSLVLFDTVYTDNQQTTPFNGENLYYAYLGDPTSDGYAINSEGILYDSCTIVPPEPTQWFFSEGSLEIDAIPATDFPLELWSEFSEIVNGTRVYVDSSLFTIYVGNPDEWHSNQAESNFPFPGTNYMIYRFDALGYCIDKKGVV